MAFIDKFRRATASTQYLPQVDGLRFLAILMVVVQMHIPNYINDKIFGGRWLSTGVNAWIMEGIHGVHLFFMISGFILAIPFAKAAFAGGEKIKLKNYYLRRIIRLEPPYIIALSLSFIALVWLLHRDSFQNLLPHYAASLFYLHNTIYGSFSTVLPLAWTLEIEVQFYILAPLFCMVFLIPNKIIRFLLYTIIAFGSLLYALNYWQGIGNVFSYLCYFFGGIAVADLHTNSRRALLQDGIGATMALISFLLFFLLRTDQHAVLFVVNIAHNSCSFTWSSTTALCKRSFQPGSSLLSGACVIPFTWFILH